MSKLVRLQFRGTLTQTFDVSLSIGEEQYLPNVERRGQLPACIELLEQYKTWRSTYRQMGARSRGLTPVGVQYKGPIKTIKERCQTQWRQLAITLNQWLQSDGFSPIVQQLREHLLLEEIIRVSLQSDDDVLWGLPWQDWSFIDHYRNAEVVFAPMDATGTSTAKALTAPVKLLAVFGGDDNLDLAPDQEMIKKG